MKDVSLLFVYGPPVNSQTISPIQYLFESPALRSSGQKEHGCLATVVACVDVQTHVQELLEDIFDTSAILAQRTEKAKQHQKWGIYRAVETYQRQQPQVSMTSLRLVATARLKEVDAEFSSLQIEVF